MPKPKPTIKVSVELSHDDYERLQHAKERTGADPATATNAGVMRTALHLLADSVDACDAGYVVGTGSASVAKTYERRMKQELVRLDEYAPFIRVHRWDGEENGHA